MAAGQLTAAEGATDRAPGACELAFRGLRCWLTVYRRIYRASIGSSVLGPVCYLAAMGYGLGSLVDRHGTVAFGGVPYVAWVSPAILATQAMQSGMSNAAFPVFSQVHWNKAYIAARATPLRPADIYRGHQLFFALRIAMNSAIFIVITAIFGVIRSAWAVFLLPAALLTGVAFATVVAAWTVTLENESPMTYMFRFGGIPLMLFSGTFFPVTQLPGWLQLVAYATPLWHGVALCRAFSLGTVDAASVAIHVAYLAVMSAAGLWAGAVTHRRRLYV